MPHRAASWLSLGRQETADVVLHARPGLRAVVLRFGWAAALVALDLGSKSAVFAWLDRLDRAGKLVVDGHGHRRQPILGDWLAFLPSLNPAAAFGHFESFPYLLVGGRIAAGLFLVWLLLRAREGRRVFTAALVLVLGGALGNLYDNVLRSRDLPLDRGYTDRPFGPVRDFVDVYVGAWNWHFETFNLADTCITAGAILLVATSILESGKHRGDRQPHREQAQRE
jgi:lipoprotein signal peptidase